jgi:peptide-methionine (S)-S-oxide reductase
VKPGWSKIAAGLVVATALAAGATGEAGSSAPQVGGDARGDSGRRATAVFAGGCFWCMEAPFDAIPGVISTTVGYTGGNDPHPTYEKVSSGTTGHAEAVQVVYDPGRVSYEALLWVFWHNVDPTTPNRQFCDRGHQYRSAIFYGTEEERRLAERTRDEVERRLGRTVVTEIVPAGPFYPAEDYHQDYYRRNPIRYQYYRFACGRDRRLEELWGSAAGH